MEVKYLEPSLGGTNKGTAATSQEESSPVAKSKLNHGLRMLIPTASGCWDPLCLFE